MESVADVAKVVLAGVSLGGILISVGIAIQQLRSVANILKGVVLEQNLQGNRLTAVEVSLEAHANQCRGFQYATRDRS